MNHPCRIYFHDDIPPESLPERHRDNLEMSVRQGVRHHALLAQNAFYIDFAPNILRTRIGGVKGEDPVDFPLESISHIEWFYGSEVPHPLTPVPPKPRREDS